MTVLALPASFSRPGCFGPLQGPENPQCRLPGLMADRHCCFLPVSFPSATGPRSVAGAEVRRSLFAGVAGGPSFSSTGSDPIDPGAAGPPPRLSNCDNGLYHFGGSAAASCDHGSCGRRPVVAHPSVRPLPPRRPAGGQFSRRALWSPPLTVGRPGSFAKNRAAASDGQRRRRGPSLPTAFRFRSGPRLRRPAPPCPWMAGCHRETLRESKNSRPHSSAFGEKGGGGHFRRRLRSSPTSRPITLITPFRRTGPFRPGIGRSRLGPIPRRRPGSRCDRGNSSRKSGIAVLPIGGGPLRGSLRRRQRPARWGRGGSSFAVPIRL